MTEGQVATQAQTPGKLIVLEGLEGCGKTTNLRFVAEWLREKGKTVVETREPGGTPLAESLRELLLTVRDEPVSPVTELWMMFAARMQHVTQVIQPALAAGKWVLCDRFLDATYAYQGGGRGLPDSIIDPLAEQVLALAAPACVLYLDIPLETSRARIEARGQLDRFEQEGEAFFANILATYRARAETLSTHSWIQADQPLPQVQDAIAQALALRFGEDL